MAAFLARRYAEAVDVLQADGAPSRFVWRGRHYTVRQVLAHWVRTGAWWQQAGAAHLVTGETATETGRQVDGGLATVQLPPSPRWGQRAWGEPAPDVGVAAAPGEVDDDEREFWRVEASIGRGVPVVLELCLAWATGSWTVTAVAD